MLTYGGTEEAVVDDKHIEHDGDEQGFSSV